MSEKEQPKKNKPDDDQSSDQSAETPKDDLSPGDDEDRWLLSPLRSAGAEVSPVVSGAGASSSKEGKKVTGMMKRCNPFRNKSPKKRKLSSPFSKAKAAFKKTFRKSESNIQTSKPESEKHRKISDPTDYRKVDLQAGSELVKRFLDSPPASTSKETETETEDEQTNKEPKSKGFFSHFYSSSKEAVVKPESKKKAEAAVQKKPLSPKISKQSSSSDTTSYSMGFFGDGMQPSESSGVPTESTSTSTDTQDVKSGGGVSREPSHKKPSTRLSKAEHDDNFSSSSD